MHPGALQGLGMIKGLPLSLSTWTAKSLIAEFRDIIGHMKLQQVRKGPCCSLIVARHWL
jgi:hypothetical protein